ncbi:ATP-binding protein [Roseomonas sp. GC11]|uniref:hybrid sensor histidine kinase/response regulator n=1 Tax=Roseomonas sp. GC11 TaxID=2950546 RepID=UPI00210C013D|nr:ATP-binding protein [Roseomonas sp. GC11]MCQ4158903.1 ATP-binding protein [Roseomonas sp. GC11]
MVANRPRIMPIRRAYNRWVANQMLEDFALRFTAKQARRWSGARVAQTALGATSFLALEAIGGTLVLSCGFTNTALAVLAAGLLIFLTGLPIGYYAARFGVDIDLLTRGAGFGYIGSTLTSLVYATFTFIFLAIESAIMALALELWLGLPLAWGYLVSSLAIVPLVVYGITLISRFQLWSQPVWLVLNLLPLGFIAASGTQPWHDWVGYPGARLPEGGFDITLFAGATGVVIALIAQIGEQVDFLRFMPEPRAGEKAARRRWWACVLAAGPGWIIAGALKILLGSFLAVLAVGQGVPAALAGEPTRMYAAAFAHVLPQPHLAIALTGLFVVLCQIKINVTNAYAGSIAWSNFFSRLTHSHPGRVVWLVFNVVIALLLMELGIYKMLEGTLSLYAIIAVAWIGAVAADLAINKPLGLSPPGIEFRRAHLYDINPVGVGAMAFAILLGLAAYAGLLGPLARAAAPLVSLFAALAAAPAIAALTRGRYYRARKPRAGWAMRGTITCTVCDNGFEAEDMAFCPAYGGPICSLCCSLDARCHDACKPQARLSAQVNRALEWTLPAPLAAWLTSRVGRYLAVMLLLGLIFSLVLALMDRQVAALPPDQHAPVTQALVTIFLVLMIILGVVVWLFLLGQESRRVALEETARQAALYRQEIAAHRKTDAELQRAKEAAEAANNAKSRYVVGLSHELRTPLNAVLGYAQLLEADPSIPGARQGGIRAIRRSAEHLSGLIDGLLDISRMEAGRLELQRNEIRLGEFLDQIVDMFRLQAQSSGLEFRFSRPERIPEVVAADEKRLRQILINLLSNAIKFTAAGHVSLDLSFRSHIAEFVVSDSGRGIPPEELPRIFEPFYRGQQPGADTVPGTGLGLTIVQLLASVMGGEVSATSRPGEGSSFRLRLLLSPVEAPARTAAKARPGGYRGPRRSILVVDDNPDHRELMREILLPLGFILFTAPDGPTALALAAQQRPDLFLLDIAMPGMNGWELAEALRAAGHDQARIAMLSANVHEILPLRGGIRPPHDDIISKPIDIDLFLGRLQVLLGLDWAEPAPPPAEPANGLIVPPRADHLGELLALGRIGYVRGIEAKLAEIEAEEPLHAPFVQEIRGLLRVYDMRRYLAFLERLRGDG